ADLGGALGDRLERAEDRLAFLDRVGVDAGGAGHALGVLHDPADHLVVLGAEPAEVGQHLIDPRVRGAGGLTSGFGGLAEGEDAGAGDGGDFGGLGQSALELLDAALGVREGLLPALGVTDDANGQNRGLAHSALLLASSSTSRAVAMSSSLTPAQ